MTKDNKTERLVAEIPADLKRLVDADKRSNKKVVKDALWKSFGGRRDGAIERRIEEIENRLSIVQRERNERNREIENLKDDLKTLQEQLEVRRENKKQTMKKAREVLENVDKNPNNPAIQNWAEELNITERELIDKL